MRGPAQAEPRSQAAPALNGSFRRDLTSRRSDAAGLFKALCARQDEPASRALCRGGVRGGAAVSQSRRSGGAVVPRAPRAAARARGPGLARGRRSRRDRDRAGLAGAAGRARALPQSQGDPFARRRHRMAGRRSDPAGRADRAHGRPVAVPHDERIRPARRAAPPSRVRPLRARAARPPQRAGAGMETDEDVDHHHVAPSSAAATSSAGCWSSQRASRRQLARSSSTRRPSRSTARPGVTRISAPSPRDGSTATSSPATVPAPCR